MTITKDLSFTYEKKGLKFNIEATAIRNTEVSFVSNSHDDAPPIEVSLDKVTIEEKLNNLTGITIYVDLLPYLQALDATTELFDAAYQEAHNLFKY